ncbi:MAG: ABC transporter permease [Parvibaculaceae bacterium]|nr:ABC transporter permease [Parvibaculaceae bacterium]
MTLVSPPDLSRYARFVQRTGRLGGRWVLAWPAVILGIFFVIPFLLLLRVSVAESGFGAMGNGGFTAASYLAAFQNDVFVYSVVFSVVLAAVVALISIAAGFPFTYAITRMSRRAQVCWLVFVLMTLSLSEVLITFAWQVMLAKRVGISNLLVWLGLMAEPVSLSPNLGAVLACLVYLVIPFTVLVLFPGMSRIDPQMAEAARTMGATPARTFFTIIVPIMRGPIVTCLMMSFIVGIGSYVAPMVLGRPEHWTVAILISKAATASNDMPLASAMSVLFLAVASVICLIIYRLGVRKV